jgi:hypothetical protein
MKGNTDMPTTTVKKPKLKLVGTDSNAFAILGAASRVARATNMTNWKEIQTKAMSGDYDNLLCTLMEHFDVE